MIKDILLILSVVLMAVVSYSTGQMISGFLLVFAGISYFIDPRELGLWISYMLLIVSAAISILWFIWLFIVSLF